MRGSALIRFLLGFLLMVLIAVLMGCQSREVRPPQVVDKVVERIVPVPSQLTVPCDEVPKRDNTVGEAVRLANARLASVQECNKRMDAIRALGR